MSSPLRTPVADPDPQPESAPELTAAAHRTPQPAGELDFELPPPTPVTRTRALTFGVAVVALLLGAFLLRWLPKRHGQAALATATTARLALTPRVQVVAPVRVASDRALSLPGSMQPFEETVVYPRTSGYIRRWLVDLGDKVKEGDLLAEIDTPDLDQQIKQARAQLAQAEAGLLQARANAEFSRTNLDRYKQLLPQGLVSQQTFDQGKAQAGVDQAGIAVSEATIGSQRANLEYLGQLKTFARVVSPFTGTVTARNVERGTLVTAGNATALFRVTALDPVRVFVQVPQDVASSIRLDVPAGVTIREFPGRTFAGKVAHAQGTLDPATRTMLTEVRVPNPKGELLPGTYAQVSFTLPTPHPVLSVPSTAVLNSAAGLQVAVVDATGHVRLAKVVVERDTGPTIEISSGLQPEDQVIKLPSAELTDGKLVEIAP